jgi:hypothetical protein
MMNHDIPDDEPAVAEEVHNGRELSPTASPVRPMTPDEARATLCRSVAAQLEESVRRAEADLDARQAAPGFEPTAETNNIALTTLAALELRDMLLVSAKQFDKSSRPRILRPERSVRIVR